MAGNNQNTNALSFYVQKYPRNTLKPFRFYSSRLRLKLNTEKTNLVCFRKKGKRFNPTEVPITLNGQLLKYAEDVTFLGISLDEHLSWESHCNKVANKISRNCGVLNRVKKTLPPSSLLTLYNSLILPHLSYGLEVWGASTCRSMKRVVGLQKKAIRIITKSHWLGHTEPRMKSLKTLKIDDLHKFQCQSLMFDMMRGFCPDIYGFRQATNESSVRYRLRSVTTQPQNLRQPSTTNKSPKKSFSAIAPKLWNELPNGTKNCSTRKEFKGVTKRTFLKKYEPDCECLNPLCFDHKYHRKSNTDHN